MFRILLVTSLVFALPAFAQQNRRRGGPGGQGGGGPNPACAPIRTACEKAGYKGRGGPQSPSASSPGTLRDCMNKWATGGTIPGLKTKPTDSSGKACADHLNSMKNRRGGPGGGGPGRGGPRGDHGGPGGPMGNNALGGNRPGAMNAKPAPPPPPPPATPTPLAPKPAAPGAPSVLPAVPTTPPPKNP